MRKATEKSKATARNDVIALCRGQHAELYDRAGQLRRVVDHPSNGQLLGTRPEVGVVRAADVALDAGDAMAVVYAGQGGAASRIATAKATQGSGDSVGLVEWQVGQGFSHAVTIAGGAKVHRIGQPAGGRSG